MANSGAHTEAKATEELFVRNFAEYDYIVASSGSCVHHIRHKFTAADDTPERRHVSSHIWDLPEFLCDVLKVEEFPWATFRTPSRCTSAARPSAAWASRR